MSHVLQSPHIHTSMAESSSHWEQHEPQVQWETLPQKNRAVNDTQCQPLSPTCQYTGMCVCTHMYTHDRSRRIWVRLWSWGNSLPLWLEMYSCKKILYKTFWQLLKKLNIRLLYGPAIPIFYVFIQRKWSVCLCRNLYTNVPRSFICDSHKLKTTQMSISGWMDGSPYVSTMEYHSAKEAGSINSCSSLGKSWNNYAEWKKSSTLQSEKRIARDSIYRKF